MLTELPAELIQEILSCFDDLRSIECVILTCRTLYSVFKGARDHISSIVIRNHIGPDVLPEAVIVLHSASIPNSALGFLTFPQTWLKERKQVSTTVTYLQAQELQRRHHYARQIALDIAHEMLAYQVAPERTGMNLPQPPSSAELHRIQRALYRWELDRTLWYLSSWIMPWKAGAPFIANEFSTIENEQLRCVHRWIYHKVNTAFRHHWIYGSGEYTEEDHPIRDDHVLYCVPAAPSRGLMTIWRSLKAETYADRCFWLKPAEGRHDPYVDSGPDPRYRPLFGHDIGLEDNKPAAMGKPFFDDPDQGPAQVWKQLYGLLPASGNRWRKRSDNFRRKGYILLDLEHVEHWFHEP